MAKKSKAVPHPAIAPEPARAPVAWEGDSLEVLRSWSAEVRQDLGNALDEVQQGKKSSLATRRMESIGDGVYELKTQDERSWYRLIYITKIEDTIYVLDCFEKNTRKTERNDLARAEARYKAVHKRLGEERKHEKQQNRTKQQAKSRIKR